MHRLHTVGTQPASGPDSDLVPLQGGRYAWQRQGRGMQRPRMSTVVVIGIAVVCAVPSVAMAGIHLRLQTPAASIAPGDTFEIEAAITIPEDRFNAFDLVVRYDPTRVAFVTTTPLSDQVGPLTSGACPTLFHRFNAYPDSVMVNLSLLCNQTFITSSGVIYRVRFRALAGLGPTTLSAGAGTRFYNAGVLVNPILAENTTVMIGGSVGVPSPSLRGGYLLEAPRPNPLPSAGVGTVEFHLPSAASVALELFDAQGRRVARQDAGDLPAGRSSVRWSLSWLAPGRYAMHLRANGEVVGRATWVKLR